MNFERLSKEQLAENLRELPGRPHPEMPVETTDRRPEAARELQVHRVEVETQNRALRDAQAELEQAVTRHIDLYDHLPVACVTVTERGRITEANRAAVELIKRERSSLLGAYLRAFLGAEDGLRLAEHLQFCVDTGEPATLEATMVSDDGGTHQVQLSSRRAPAPNESAPLIRTAITDISELKRTRRMLDEIKREQEAFNRSVSHDLRAPLVTISNYAKLIESDFGGLLPPEGQTMLRRIELAAVRMEQLMLRLVEFTNLPREPVDLAPIDLDAVVHDWLVEFRAQVQQCGAQITIEPRPLPPVLASLTMLKEVVANLMSNALKYAPPGRPPRVRVSAESREQTVVFVVADDGIGIPEKYHDRVFRIFERLHGYSVYPGTGVGLAIVRRALDRMGGRVWLESEPGKGSRFFVELRRP